MSMSMSLAQAGTQNEAIILMIVGMAVVFAALGLLLMVITLINRLAMRGMRPVEQVVAAQQPPHAMDSVDPEFIAVLTAAATAALRRPTRVRRVRFAGHVDSAWARIGRQVLMGSHNLLHRHHSG